MKTKQQTILFLFLTVIGLTIPYSVKAQYSLYVGESVFLETPDPPYNGWIENANWTRDSHISISDQSFAGAIICPSHYFEGTETVTCTYTFGYYSGTTPRAGQSQKTYYITCKKVTGKLSEDQLNMTIGQKKRLNYYPDYSGYTSYTNKYVTWESSNDDVATVDSKGNVTAVSSGKATITFDPIGGPLLFCYVTVEYIEPTSISFNEPIVSVAEGKQKTLSYTFSPNGATASVKWKSSNESIVKVSSTGTITGVSEGSATITISTDKGLSATCTVNVIPAPKSVSLPEAQDITIGYAFKLNPTLTPSNAMTSFKWTTDNSEIISVDSSGKVKGKAVGGARITVMTENGKTASCHITVKNAAEGMDYRNVTVRTNTLKKLINNTLSNIKK